MLVLLVGASGGVGDLIGQQLKAARHDVVCAGRDGGDFYVDLTSTRSIKTLFARVGKVDAIVSTTCDVQAKPEVAMGIRRLEAMRQAQLLGQVRLALIGRPFLNDKGSITLTSGLLSEEPIPDSDVPALTSLATIEGFVRGAAASLKRGIRINAVTPALTESELDYDTYFREFEVAADERLARAYRRSVDGAKTGQIYRVW